MGGGGRVSADHTVKQSEKLENICTLSEKQIKKLSEMKVPVVLFIISLLGTVLKRLAMRLEELGRIEIIPITALLKSSRMLRRVLEY